MNAINLINWVSSDNDVMVNPRLPPGHRKRVTDILKRVDTIHSHVWLASSGSSGHEKWVALSKEALLISAKAVNEHLQSTSRDVWFHSLPLFHVGGLGILARCYVGGSACVHYQSRNERWDVLQFTSQIADAKATLTSLVPAQVFDVVKHSIKAPSSLRAAIVGGGAMSNSLYQQAIALGWKLLPSYGMTECSSQVATAPLGCWEHDEFPLLQPLQHVDMKVDPSGHLIIKSPSLLSLSGIITETETDHFFDPKREGWFTTEDRVVFSGTRIQSISRDANFIKIGGESVDMQRLERIFNEIMLSFQPSFDVVAVPMADKRLGYVIHAVTTAESVSAVQDIVDGFNRLVLPFERIRNIHIVEEIPRSPLNKVLMGKIKYKR